MRAWMIDALDGIGFEWDVRDAMWKERYDELREYREVHGDCLVPQRHEENPSLATWVRNQRTQRRNYLARQLDPDVATTMTATRIRALEDLGFCWNTYNTTWHRMLESWKEYYRRNPTKRKEDDLPEEVGELRFWVMYQQRAYKNKLQGSDSPHLTEDRIKILNATGFVWEGAYQRNTNTEEEEGPSMEDWDKLLKEMKKKGIDQRAKKKNHWFDGIDIRNGSPEFTEKDLERLWAQGGEDDW